ncbi:GNAT family N-acetyltransferase [Geochorda subterranea]|uniref:GNAT family protein n=1 Tax=Geochorda subterranea TaxID=3109564 RepID=A0ABZ1BPG1_9FIRM|nr:GNAT family protein [Limnochorda sp. LNt]WRP14614.1 GNAT family protein [Limnochorda sp. LNt]
MDQHALEAIAGEWSRAGERVRLRCLSEADLPARLAMTNDPDVQIATVGTTVGQRTPYDIRSWFATLAADPHSRQIAMEDESGRYIGDFDLHSIDPRQGEAWIEALLGDPEIRERGPEAVAAYLTDGLRTLLRYVFDEMGLERVLVECLSTNPVLEQALRALGFVEDGQIDHLNGVVSHVMVLTREHFGGRTQSRIDSSQ